MPSASDDGTELALWVAYSSGERGVEGDLPEATVDQEVVIFVPRVGLGAGRVPGYIAGGSVHDQVTGRSRAT